MSHGKVTPQLRHWIVKQIESGQSPESVLQSLVGNGWPGGAALEVLLDVRLEEGLLGADEAERRLRSWWEERRDRPEELRRSRRPRN